MNILLEHDVTKVQKSANSGAIYQKSCASCSSPAKYCCPKCSTLSCSLTCVKKHKEQKSCDGVRDKTAFVSVDSFHEKHLCSDLHFLEDMNRKIDNVSKAKKNYGRLYKKPINLEKLRWAARVRKTTLDILPIVFSKRKTSTTFLRYCDNKIFWRIEWSFPLCDVTYSDERIDEEVLLGKCLDKYLLPDHPEVNDKKLEYYHSMGHNGIAVLLQDENTNNLRGRYHILRQHKSLKVNFRGKRIIEFPTLLIVPKIHLCAYDVIE